MSHPPLFAFCGKLFADFCFQVFTLNVYATIWAHSSQTNIVPALAMGKTYGNLFFLALGPGFSPCAQRVDDGIKRPALFSQSIFMA